MRLRCTCIKTDITYYINKPAYVHMLNENKDFVVMVKIFMGSTSVLPCLAVYIYYFYEDTEFIPPTLLLTQASKVNRLPSVQVSLYKDSFH